MKRVAAVCLLLAAPAMAQDFSAGSEAKPWGLAGEAPARFEAEVVDLLCSVAGDCEAACEGAHRALGLRRSADGVLVVPMKNGEPVFAGASVELSPYCGQMVEVDGLMITNPETGARNAYMVQRLRAAGEGEWVPGTRWGEVWAAEHPGAAGKGPWFRNDPRVNAEIEADGYLGLGPAADRAFIADWF
jgi:hypothetical protein